jgi:uncharacterized protein YdeI (YjbR/CyaY-like superfamily)
VQVKTVTLSSGVEFVIAPLKLRQVEAIAPIAKENPIQATLETCVEAIKNAGGQVSVDDLKEFSIPDLNELAERILELSGITPGEVVASR